MGVNIKRDAADVDIDAAEYQPLLNNLQANILRPHGRDNVRHIFIAFTSTPQSGWRWLNSLLPKIISAHQQYEQIKARAQNPGLMAAPSSMSTYLRRAMLHWVSIPMNLTATVSNGA